MPKVSIILVNYNTRELTLQAIESIYTQTKEIEYEIIVVDNASEDDSVEQIEKTYPNIVLIKNTENKGFGIANNIGAEVAKGDYIFLLNTDTILVNNAVKKLADYLDSNRDVAVVGGNLYSKDMNPAISYCRLFPGLITEINDLLFGLISKLLYSKNYIFNNTDSSFKFFGTISGADAMIRKTVFDELGGFDDDFFLYYEETELFYRITQMGYKVASNPSAKIIHLEGASEDKKSNSHHRSFKSKWIYYSKHKNRMSTYLAHRLFNLNAIQRILIFKMLGNKEKIKYWKMLKSIENYEYINMKRK